MSARPLEVSGESPWRWCLTLPSLALLGWLPVLAARGPAPAHGTDVADSMLGAVVAFGLPLLLLGVYSSFPRSSLSPQQRSLLRYGLDQKPAAFRQLVVRSLALLALGLLFAGLSIWLGRGAQDPRLVRDLQASSGAMALGALGLAGWFSLAASWGGQKGLWLALVVTWTLGHVPAVIAAAVPVGHLRHLLGLGVALPFPQWVSALSLGVSGALLLGLTVWRLPR